MTAERFHTHLRNDSAPFPHTPVSGMEWKGMEEEWRTDERLHASSLSEGVGSQRIGKSAPNQPASMHAMNPRWS